MLRELHQLRLLRLFVVDEAHCLPEQGLEWRPDYLVLELLRRYFEPVPILCLTATAPTDVLLATAEFLRLRDVSVFRGSCVRAQMQYEVVAVSTGTHRLHVLVGLVAELLEGDAAGQVLIYAETRTQ